MNEDVKTEKEMKVLTPMTTVKIHLTFLLFIGTRFIIYLLIYSFTFFAGNLFNVVSILLS